MPEDKFELGDERWYSTQNWRSRLKPWLDSVFELFRIIYYERIPKNRSLIAQEMQMVLVALVWCIQISSLIWVPNLSISDWDKNDDFWKFVGYIRLDNACSAYGVLKFCIYASIAIHIATIIGIIGMVALIHYSIVFPGSFIIFLKKFLYGTINFSEIPMLALLSICLKYNWISKNSIPEYFENNDISNFKVSKPIQFLIFCGIIGNFLIMILNNIFSGEIRHSMAKRKMESKAYSNLDIRSSLFTLLAPIIFCIIGSDYSIFFQIILMVFSFFLALETIVKLPFFNFFANCLAILKFATVSLMSFLFIFGRILDTSFVVALFTFTILPIILIVLIKHIKHLSKHLIRKIPTNHKNIKNIFNFEHNLRYFLSINSSENKDQVLYLFGKCFSETSLCKSKIFIVWEVNYCIFAIEDEALAKIKLSKSKYSNNSLEGNYQEYVCKIVLSEFEGHDSVEFLNFFQKINKLKKLDATLCVKLLDFWKELASMNPKVEKLYKMLDFIPESIEYIAENYSNLHEKFPKSKEALSYYFSFVKYILCDFGKSNQLGYKFQTIENLTSQSSPKKGTKNMTFFDENNGIMFISCSHTNFGKIVYANQKSSEILKYPINEIIGNNFSFFIPHPYDSCLNHQTSDFYQLANEIKIKIPSHFFLLLPNKFIINCTGKASLISIKSNFSILFAFQEVKSLQEFALISEEGEIYSYTENFKQFARIFDGELIGSNIKYLFPSLQNIELQPFIPYLLSDIDKEIFLILCFIEFYNIKISYVTLINDPSEIETLNINEGSQYIEENIDSSPKHFISCNTFSKKEENKSSSVLKTESQLKMRIESESESSSWCHNIDKIASLSTRSIKIFHIVMVSAMLTAIVTNSIVLIYTATAIVEGSNIELNLLLGKIEKSIQALGHFSRGVNVLTDLNGPQELIDYSYEHFIINLEVLKEIRLNVTEDINNWKSCGGNDIFIDENVWIWNIDDDFKLEKTNLINAISEFIMQGKSFLEKWNNHEDQTKEIQFFNLNGINQVFNYCNSSFYRVTDCAMNNINGLEYRMDILLMASFGILVISVGLTIPFIKYVINTENNLWNQIKKHVYDHYESLKNACLDRLASMHGKSDILFSDVKHTSTRGNFRNHWKYIWRYSVYLVLALVFFLVNLLYLYDDCANYLYLRPSLIRAVINSQVLTKTLIVWTSEASVVGSPVELKAILPDLYQFKNPFSCLNDVISALTFSEKEIRDSKYSSLLSDEFRQIFFETTENVNKIADYGVYAAGGVLPFDAFYFDYYATSDIGLWFDLVQAINALDKEYDLLVDIVDKDSQNVITNQIQWIEVALALFIVSSLILYFGFYLSFLIGEQKILEKMKIIAKLIPGKFLA